MNNNDRKFLHSEKRSNGGREGARAVLVHVERIRHNGNERMNEYVQNATV